MQSTSPSPVSQRTPLHLDVHFKRSYAREETIGTIKNISLTGAFLRSPDHSFKLNEKIQLRFIVSGRERKVAGQVIWLNSSGCGIRFLPLNNRDIQIVDDLIYFVENSRNDRRGVFENILKKVA